MEMTAVIPVIGPAPAIDNVVRSAYRSKYVTSVVVVAHESAARVNSESDEGRTRDEVVAGVVRRAALAGASVTFASEPGRGSLVLKATEIADTEAVIFLDADLRGLLTHHVDMLAWPLAENRAAMASGLIDSGTVLNQVFTHLLPVLTRQRAVKRELIEGLEPDSVINGNFESDLERLARRTGVPTHTAVLEGVWQAPTFTANARFGSFLGTIGRAIQYASHPFGIRLPRVGQLPESPSGKESSAA